MKSARFSFAKPDKQNNRSETMTDQVNLIPHSKFLEELENSSTETHLLMGNGFNSHLGVHTTYKNIFIVMKKECLDYDDVDYFMRNNQYDIELLIKHLQKETPNDFVKKIIGLKIKFDFMKAAYSIVRENIKNIYQEQDRDIHLLLKNFTNYFTLNYDPLLYLLLMKFKKDPSDKKVVGFQQNYLIQIEDLNEQQNQIYNKILEAHEHGKIDIHSLKNKADQNLKDSPKAVFISIVKKLYKEEGWATKDIKRACNLMWINKENHATLEPINVNDGFSKSQNGFLYTPKELQNVYFLHGSFHIYQDGEVIKKITQTQDSALYELLGNIIDSAEKDIVCVLKGTSAEKMNHIENNKYLEKAHKKLTALQGHLVIWGSSLDDNDMHIFDAINSNNKISRIYISSNERKKNKNHKRAHEIFPKKNDIQLFNYDVPKAAQKNITS